MNRTSFLRSLVALAACVTAWGCVPDIDVPEPRGALVSLRTESLQVPVDEANPSVQNLSLDYAIYRSVEVLNGERRAPRGVLAFHFGGPGTDNVLSYSGFLTVVPDEILLALADQYVVVALNEIGVSTGAGSNSSGGVALDCNDRFDPEAGDFDDLLVDAEDFATACQSEFNRLDDMTSARAARDLERLRNELGYDTLSIYGFGEGARVALSYGAQFPSTAGQIVLDSPVDPSRPLLDRIADRAANLEATLDRFLAWCDSVDSDICPFGDGDAVGELQRWLDELPSSGSGEPTDRLLLRTIIDRLDVEAAWPSIGFRLAEIRAENQEFPVPEGLTDAFYGFSCGDAAAAPSSMELDTFFTNVVMDSPRVGPLLVGEAFPCAFWIDPDDRIDWSTELANLPPLMILSNALDPIAPSSWAENLAAQIPAAILVTAPEANNSIGLQNFNLCVDNFLADYFLNGQLPAKDSQCEAGELSVLF